MTQEEKARAYDEALKKARFYHGNCPSEPERKKLEGMFPVLRESEDERTRKWLLDYAIEMIAGLESDISLSTYDGIKGHDPEAEAELAQWQKARAYLEKQKENIEKEYVFRPLAGTDINSAALQAIRKADEGYRLVLAFNGAYIPVRKGCTANKIVDIYDSFIEKQQEPHYTKRNALFDKCVENCDPEVMKKVSDEVDEVLEKEQKPAEHKAFEEWVEDYWSHNKVNNPYSYNKGDEVQFDHKGFVSFCEAYCYPQNFVLHDTFGYEEGRQTGQNEGVKFVLNNPEKYGLQKPAGWSEEDEDMRLEAIRVLVSGCERYRQESGCLPGWSKVITWLKSLPERFSLQPKQEWNDEDEKMIKNIIESLPLWATGQIAMLPSQAEEYVEKLKSLLPSWKPSDEQMKALDKAIPVCMGVVGRDEVAPLESLYEQLKKL